MFLRASSHSKCSHFFSEPDSNSYFGKSSVHEINEFGGNASIGDREDAFVDSIANFGSGGSISM